MVNFTEEGYVERWGDTENVNHFPADWPTTYPKDLADALDFAIAALRTFVVGVARDMLTDDQKIALITLHQIGATL